MFDHCLYFNSSALARVAEREWAAVYAPFGLTPAQGFVLRVVLASPGCLSSQVAGTLGIARPTATRFIDNLSEKRLVERRQAESDGREWCVGCVAIMTATQQNSSMTRSPYATNE